MSVVAEGLRRKRGKSVERFATWCEGQTGQAIMATGLLRELA